MAVGKICVVGLGYIGLPTAAVFASRKIQVIGIDVNQNAIDTINRGEIHIVEPDLDMVVNAAVGQGYLRASRTPEPADAFLIAVPTPFAGDHHDPDLSYVEAAAKAIAPGPQDGGLGDSGVHLAGGHHRAGGRVAGRGPAGPELSAAGGRAVRHPGGPLS